ncbi:MAG: AIR synthase related protein [Tepidisphaerales bacterium]
MSPTPPPQGLTYESAGVDYTPLDAFKRACQAEAATTTANLALHKLAEVPGIRGESAYLVESDTEFWAHVEEGLGTKNLVADAVKAATGVCHYRAIGIDTVATIVNDLVTTGALPVAVAMHAAVGSTDWFNDRERCAQLAQGFAHGCHLAGAVWSGGETPALRDLIRPEAIVLAGSAVGRLAPKSLRVRGDLRDGDAIVLLASSGIHTNGLTLCRRLAERLPAGYLEKLPSGETYGKALLTPSVIYCRFVAALHHADLRPRYLAHITGHGWRKLMRLPDPFVYTVHQPFAPGLTLETTAGGLFQFIMDRGPVSLAEAFATFNMGAGFAAFVAPEDVEPTLKTAASTGYTAWHAGTVRKDGLRKAVEIPSLGLTFDGHTLQVR